MRWAVCIVIIALLTVGPGTARGQETDATAFGDWALRCGAEPNSCAVEQRVFVEGAGDAPLVHVAVQALTVVEGSQSGRKSLWLTLRVPLGVKLVPGLHIRVDSGPVRNVALHHCRSAGCIALVPLSADFRKQLEAGRRAAVTFFAMNGQGITVPVSLDGFTAGIVALEKRAAP